MIPFPKQTTKTDLGQTKYCSTHPSSKHLFWFNLPLINSDKTKMKTKTKTNSLLLDLVSFRQYCVYRSSQISCTATYTCNNNLLTCNLCCFSVSIWSHKIWSVHIKIHRWESRKCAIKANMEPVYTRGWSMTEWFIQLPL